MRLGYTVYIIHKTIYPQPWTALQSGLLFFLISPGYNAPVSANKDPSECLIGIVKLVEVPYVRPLQDGFGFYLMQFYFPPFFDCPVLRPLYRYEPGVTSRSLITLKAKRRLFSRSEPLTLFYRLTCRPSLHGFHSVHLDSAGPWSVKDSNLQPAAYEAVALTIGLTLLRCRQRGGWRHCWPILTDSA